MVRVLVVDDSQVERLLVEGLLRKKQGYEVVLAESGEEAMQAVESQHPDLVVCDLVMPGMDGLEVVRTMRRNHPNIPVILLTAFGDETMAAQALDAGAASYVPKARKAEFLISTIERVAEHALSDRTRRRLGRSMLEFHCRYALENDLSLIEMLVEQVEQVMADLEFGDTVERIRVSEALEEALLNAMYHGNLEIREQELNRVRAELDEELMLRLIEERCRDKNIAARRVLVKVQLTRREARFVIRDQGRGFRVGDTDNRSDAEHFIDGHHRGLTLMRSMMDEVTYNQCGNELTMLKSCADALV